MIKHNDHTSRLIPYAAATSIPLTYHCPCTVNLRSVAAYHLRVSQYRCTRYRLSGPRERASARHTHSTHSTALPADTPQRSDRRPIPIHLPLAAVTTLCPQLPAGSSISLPFWLVSILSHRLPHDFAYSLPPIYNPTRNSALLADPRAFNLSLYPHYYTLSILLYQLPVAPTAANSDDSAQYQQLLLRHMTQVMDERYKEIVTKSASCSRGGRGRLAGMGSDLLRSGGECGFLSSPGVEAAAKLSVWERDVFGWNALALRKFEWWKGQVGPMRVTDRSGGMGMGLVERKRVYGGGGESGSNRDRNKRGRG